MAVQNYSDLIAHNGHKIVIVTLYNESVAIECEDCHEVLLNYDNEEWCAKCGEVHNDL
jgi:Zn finger protein HypA/HybF involved in hydrogenase expression